MIQPKPRGARTTHNNQKLYSAQQPFSILQKEIIFLQQFFSDKTAVCATNG